MGNGLQMARIKKESGKVVLSKTIDRLIEGDYDTPIVEAGSFGNRLTLGKLNILRMKMRDQRDEANRKEEKLKMDVSAVAHDLKTPLTVISGYAECLEDGLDDKNYLELISKSVSQMNEQVVNFVESMRSEMNGKEPVTEKIKAREFFTVELEKYKNIAETMGIRLRHNRIPKVTLYAVRSDLSSLLQNLLSNAFKYCGKDKKVILRFSSFRKVLRIKVKDHGIGIPKTDLPYVFDRFYMVDKSRNSSNSSGLGLYIVKTNVEKMHGKVTVKSKENKGTTFTLSIPWESDNLDVQMSQIGRLGRLIVTILFGWGTASIIRFLQFSQTGNYKFLIAGLYLIPFFFVGWFADILSVFLTGKFTLLME